MPGAGKLLSDLGTGGVVQWLQGRARVATRVAEQVESVLDSGDPDVANDLLVRLRDHALGGAGRAQVVGTETLVYRHGLYGGDATDRDDATGGAHLEGRI